MYSLRERMHLNFEEVTIVKVLVVIVLRAQVLTVFTY